MIQGFLVTQKVVDNQKFNGSSFFSCIMFPVMIWCYCLCWLRGDSECFLPVMIWCSCSCRLRSDRCNLHSVFRFLCPTMIFRCLTWIDPNSAPYQSYTVYESLYSFLFHCCFWCLKSTDMIFWWSWFLGHPLIHNFGIALISNTNVFRMDKGSFTSAKCQFC